MTSQDPLNKPYTIAQITDAHVGLVSHLSYIGSYDLGLTEGFPPPPSA